MAEVVAYFLLLSGVGVRANVKFDLTQSSMEKRLLSFNTTKTKLVTFHYHQKDLESAPFLTCDHTLKESPCLARLLGLKLTPTSNGTRILVSSQKMLEDDRFLVSLQKIPDSWYHCSVCKRDRSDQECKHIQAVASQLSLSILDRAQKRLRGLVSDEIFSTL